MLYPKDSSYCCDSITNNIVIFDSVSVQLEQNSFVTVLSSCCCFFFFFFISCIITFQPCLILQYCDLGWWCVMLTFSVYVSLASKYFPLPHKEHGYIYLIALLSQRSRLCVVCVRWLLSHSLQCLRHTMSSIEISINNESYLVPSQE